MNELQVLIIDDEAQTRKLLEITLQNNGYKVYESAFAKEGLIMAANHPPDVVLLDLGLPDENGHAVLRKLREWYHKPVIILSIQNSEQDIVSALDNGANDYLVKPFRTGELLARLRSVLRNADTNTDHPLLVYEDLQVDLAARTVKQKEEFVKLTSTEYNLLALLAKNEGKVLTHRYLLKQVWGPSYTNQTQYLRVFIAQLRKKIEENPNHPKYIITESGVGYRFTGKDPHER